MTLRVADHAEHRWERRGQCVYCADCDVRLYQGCRPGPRKQAQLAQALDTIRDFLADHDHDRGVGLLAVHTSPEGLGAARRAASPSLAGPPADPASRTGRRLVSAASANATGKSSMPRRP